MPAIAAAPSRPSARIPQARAADTPRRPRAAFPVMQMFSQVRASLDVTTNCDYNWTMGFDWDEDKRQSNIRDHGIDFFDVPPLFDGHRDRGGHAR